MSHLKILVVDDEYTVGEVLGLYLNSKGHVAEIFASAEEVLALSHCELREYDVLLTDYDMPGRNGVELAKCLRHINPGIQVIVMSGKINFVAFEASQVGSILRKPFGLRDLTQLLEHEKKSPQPTEFKALIRLAESELDNVNPDSSMLPPVH